MGDEDRAAWLHRLTAEQIKALYDFRRAARETQPDAVNAMDAAWDDAPAPVRAMPRAFVVSLDRPA